MSASREWRVIQRRIPPSHPTEVAEGERAVRMSDEAAARKRQDHLDALFADGVRRIEVVRIESREVGPWEDRWLP